MEPKYCDDELIRHPNHRLRIWLDTKGQLRQIGNFFPKLLSCFHQKYLCLEEICSSFDTFILKYEKRTLWIPKTTITSWWFQPVWKILAKLGSFSPSKGENKHYLKPPPSLPNILPLIPWIFWLPPRWLSASSSKYVRIRYASNRAFETTT